MGKPAKNTICLWYDRDAEDAARHEKRAAAAGKPTLRTMQCMAFLRLRSEVKVAPRSETP